jgi:hypothetical protein
MASGEGALQRGWGAVHNVRKHLRVLMISARVRVRDARVTSEQHANKETAEQNNNKETTEQNDNKESSERHTNKETAEQNNSKETTEQHDNKDTSERHTNKETAEQNKTTTTTTTIIVCGVDPLHPVLPYTSYGSSPLAGILN